MGKDQPDNLGFSLWQGAGVINRLLQEYYDFLINKQEASNPLDYDEIQRLNEIRSSNALNDVFWFLCARSKQLDMPPDMWPDMQKLYCFIVDKGLYMATLYALNARMEILQPYIDSLERQKRIYKDDPLMRTNEEAEYRRIDEILCWLDNMKEKEQQTAAPAVDQEQQPIINKRRGTAKGPAITFIKKRVLGDPKFTPLQEMKQGRHGDFKNLKKALWELFVKEFPAMTDRITKGTFSDYVGDAVKELFPDR